MKRKLIIYGCPYCKEYLPKIDVYKICMYCGKKYNKNALIIIGEIEYENKN